MGLRTAAAGAVWELERRPESAVPLPERLLDSNRNLDAIDILGRIGPPAAAVLPRLRQILNAQAKQNAQNEQNDAAVLNIGNVWALVHVASALWEIGGDTEAGIVVQALLRAWEDNNSTARDVVARLNRMGPAKATAAGQGKRLKQRFRSRRAPGETLDRRAEQGTVVPPEQLDERFVAFRRHQMRVRDDLVYGEPGVQEVPVVRLDLAGCGVDGHRVGGDQGVVEPQSHVLPECLRVAQHGYHARFLASRPGAAAAWPLPGPGLRTRMMRVRSTAPSREQCRRTGQWL